MLSFSGSVSESAGQELPRKQCSCCAMKCNSPDGVLMWQLVTDLGPALQNLKDNTVHYPLPATKSRVQTEL